MSKPDQRQELIGGLKKAMNSDGGNGFYGDIADFIISDRKRVCGPLVRYKKINVLNEDKDYRDDVIDQTLKLAGLE